MLNVNINVNRLTFKIISPGLNLNLPPRFHMQPAKNIQFGGKYLKRHLNKPVQIMNMYSFIFDIVIV